jgi:hypothetical protein
MEHAKIVHVQQAKSVHLYKNTKEKLLRKMLLLFFNKMCRPNYLNPESVHITDQLKESTEY